MTKLAIFDCDGTLVDSGATIHAALRTTLDGHGIACPPPAVTRKVIGLSLEQAMAQLVPDGDHSALAASYKDAFIAMRGAGAVEEPLYDGIVELLDAHGIACPPPAVTRKVIGLSLEQAMAQLVPEGDHSALAASYKDAFIAMRGAGAVEEPLYEGIVELLDALEADGWLLGVATGKSDRGLRHCLAGHGIADRFVTLQTADRNPSKPHPAMALAAMAEAGAAPQKTVFIGDTGWDMGCARAAGCGAIGVGWGYHDHDEMIAMGAHQVADTPAEVAELAKGWIDG